MSNFNEEIYKKAKQVKTVEELMVLAQDSNIEITKEEAEKYFSMLNSKAGELSDEELDSASGGACHTDNGDLVTTALNSCGYWEGSPNKGKHYCKDCEKVRKKGLKYICAERRNNMIDKIYYGY